MTNVGNNTTTSVYRDITYKLNSNLCYILYKNSNKGHYIYF